jgi:hypothetical protein
MLRCESSWFSNIPVVVCNILTAQPLRVIALANFVQSLPENGTTFSYITSNDDLIAILKTILPSFSINCMTHKFSFGSSMLTKSMPFFLHSSRAFAHVC